MIKIKGEDLTVGMMITVDDKLYKIEELVDVNIREGQSLLKAVLRDLAEGSFRNKTFYHDQIVEEGLVGEKELEFLYKENGQYVFLDTDLLQQLNVSPQVVGDKEHYLKEGTKVQASVYKETVVAIVLPEFIELMIVDIQETISSESGSSVIAVLETGGKITVHSFIEIGDIVKVNTESNEFIQRI